MIDLLVAAGLFVVPAVALLAWLSLALPQLETIGRTSAEVVDSQSWRRVAERESAASMRLGAGARLTIRPLSQAKGSEVTFHTHLFSTSERPKRFETNKEPSAPAGADWVLAPPDDQLANRDPVETADSVNSWLKTQMGAAPSGGDAS